MLKSAFLKLDRAAERVAELNELFRKKRPFAYVLETNTKTGQRATYAKENEAVVASAALISGDAAHNIRSALDHAYWEIVSPVGTTEKERRAVQFPFSKTAARLEEAVKKRLAHKVSPRFFDAIMGLKPHGEVGGNRLLYLIDQLDAPDKHRVLTPMANYARLSTNELRKQIPDIPSGYQFEIEVSANARDLCWHTGNFDRSDLGTPVPPTTCVFEKELNVPVDIVFAVGTADQSVPAIPTLNQLIDVAKKTVRVLAAAAR
jgi:hypothetical protein